MNPYLSAFATRSVHLVCCVVVLLLSFQSLRAQSLEELWTVEVGPFGHDIGAVEFFPDGEKFAVVYTILQSQDVVQQCFVEVRSVEDGSLIASRELTEYFQTVNGELRSLDVSSDGKQIAVGLNHLVIWDWESDNAQVTQISREGQKCDADQVFFKNDDSKVAVISWSGVFIIDVESHSIEYEVTNWMLGESIFNAYITPDFKSIGALLNTSRRTAIIYVEEEKIDISLFDLGLRPVVSHDGQFVYSLAWLEEDEGNPNYFLVKHDATNMVLKSEIELDSMGSVPERWDITSDDKYLLYFRSGTKWYLIDALLGTTYRINQNGSELRSGAGAFAPDDSSIIMYGSKDITLFSTDLTITDVDNESASESSISVFPNPSTKGFSIAFEGFSAGRMNVALMSMLGETLLRKEIITESQQGVIELTSEDLSRTGSGQYLLTLTGQNGEQASTAVVLE